MQRAALVLAAAATVLALASSLRSAREFSVASDAGLILQSPTTPPRGVRLHAEDERIFFLTETDVQVTFVTDGRSRATGLVVRFAGTDTEAPRVDEEARRP